MATTNAQLHAAASKAIAALGRAAGKGSSVKPVEVQFAKAAAPVGEDEILVVVLSQRRGVVSRTTVGRAVNFHDLSLRLVGTEIAVEKLGVSGQANAPQLTASEAALLDGAGFAEGKLEPANALERSLIEFEQLLRTSLTLEQAAKQLHVSTGRLRQRLAPEKRTLYGIKEGRSWRIPKFQIGANGKLIRGLDAVIPRIRPNAHPLAVERWFVTPHQDLVDGDDEQRVSPLDWLATGKSAAEVAALAEEI